FSMTLLTRYCFLCPIVLSPKRGPIPVSRPGQVFRGSSSSFLVELDRAWPEPSQVPEILIVAKAATACGCRTVGIRASARNDSASGRLVAVGTLRTVVALVSVGARPLRERRRRHDRHQHQCTEQGFHSKLS